MKTLTTTLLLSLFVLSFTKAKTTVLIRDWASFAGNSDSTFKTPVLTDGDYTYVATSTGTTDADILIVKYDVYGDTSWTNKWSGAGNGRDQASDMAMDDGYLYVCGITLESTAHNFDYVTLKIKKSDGGIEWVSKYNGTTSDYDVATSIDVNDSGVYVTGTTNDSAEVLNYTIIKYTTDGGNEVWRRTYNNQNANLMDIPFDLAIRDDSMLIVTGASQNSLTDWDYQTITYKYDGTVYSSNRVSGSGAGFDRAQAVKSDASGNVYITGAAKDNSSGFDIKTIKIKLNGTIAWISTIDGQNQDDEGRDLIVDEDGNVYISGMATIGQEEFLVIKLDSSGNVDWQDTITQMGEHNRGNKMCFDSNGNIIVTGTAQSPYRGDHDFLTVGIDPDGKIIWQDYFNGADQGDDEATDITSDNDGNIYVTGQAWINSELQTVTIKYRTDYFTQPPSVDTPSVAYLFYPNSGQIVDVNDSVHYYTEHHYPQLYFGFGVMNMVWSKMDEDSATTDTLQRVDVTFLNSSNPTEAYPADENDSSGYLNYYFAQCPNGITNVHGNGSLVFTDIYSGIDAIYSSNNAGLKLLFVCDPGSDPSEIGLAFEGQNSLSVSQGNLAVNTLLGNYYFEKPRVYQLDNNNNRIPINTWSLHWNIPTSGEAKFTGWGSYDGSKSIVIEISRISNSTATMPPNADWGTYLGVNGNDDAILDNTIDLHHNYYVCGFTRNNGFPGSQGTNVFQDSLKGTRDAFVTKFLPTQELKWTTYYGGSVYSPTNNIQNEDIPFGITATKDGNILLVGFTTSSDFPLPSSNPVSGGYFQDTLNGEADGFIVELDSNGSRTWATLFGGNTIDNIHAVIQPVNTDYIIICGSAAGHTTDPQPPTGPFGPIVYYQIRDSCFSSTSHQNLFWAGLPLCNSGTGYFDDHFTQGIPRKGFLAKFGLYDKQIKHSTLFGGTGEAYLQDLAFDSHNNLLVIGRTTATTTSQTCSVPSSGALPLCNNVNGYFQTIDSSSNYCGILAEFNSSFDLQWSTFFGGCDDIIPTHLAFNKHNDLYVTGYMGSSNNTLAANQCIASNSCAFPLCRPDTSYYFRDHFNHSNNSNINVGEEIFVTRFDTSKNITWSTFYGGSGDDYNDISALYRSEANADISIDTSNYVYIFSTSKHIVSGGIGDVDLATKPGLYLDNNNQSPFLASRDAILAVFGNDNKLNWATYIGGDGNELGTSVCADGNFLYVAGIADNPSGAIDTLQIGSNLGGSPYVQGHPGNNSNLDGFIWRFDRSNILINVNEIYKNHYSINAFPNPSPGLINIDLSNIKINNSTMIEVTNLIGKTVYLKPAAVNEKNNLIDLNFLPNSIYIIRIFDKSISLSSKIVILK